MSVLWGHRRINIWYLLGVRHMPHNPPFWKARRNACEAFAKCYNIGCARAASKSARPSIRERRRAEARTGFTWRAITAGASSLVNQRPIMLAPGRSPEVLLSDGPDKPKAKLRLFSQEQVQLHRPPLPCRGGRMLLRDTLGHSIRIAANNSRRAALLPVHCTASARCRLTLVHNASADDTDRCLAQPSL